MSITLERLKTSLYCDCVDTDDWNTIIQELITSITDQIISYIDDSDTIEKVADFSDELERAACKQIAYEFKQRGNLGLSSQSFPDGSISKWEIDEWLPSVEKILDRYRKLWLA